MISDTDLAALNKRGLIPGPEEDCEQFLKRISQIGAFDFETSGAYLENADWEGAARLTKSLFDVSPDWIPGFVSKRGLPFWQGAALWISEGSPALPVVQVNPKVKSDEVLAHEALHAARVAFNEPLFEEFFAYRASGSAWKRWLGPIFRSSKESYVFIGLLGCSLAYDIFQFLFEWEPIPAFLLPLGGILWGILRLRSAHRVFARSRERLKQLLHESWRADAVLFRLTDKEIRLFSKSSAAEIEDYANKQSSLRWRAITVSYFARDTFYGA